jgi:hypothetical protein
MPPDRQSRPGGGRTWWAHFEFTRINITPTVLRKEFEEFREAGATLLNAAASGRTYLELAVPDCRASGGGVASAND